MKYSILLFVAIVFFALGPAQAQNQPNVLVESFGATTCGPCGQQDPLLESYDSTHPNVIIINYHTNIPIPGDPFYKASQADEDARIAFWNVQSNPIASINGFPSTAYFRDWKGVITQDAAASLSSTVSISQQSMVGDSVILLLTVNGNTGSSVTLDVALIESGLFYVNQGAYGRPAGDIWNNVFRKMLPGPNGTPAFTLSGTRQFRMAFDTVGTGWHLNNMQAVAFVQNVPATQGTGAEADVQALAVLNFGTAGVVTHMIHQDFSFGVASPNPFIGSTNLSLFLGRSGDVVVDIMDLLGRKVATPINQYMGAGQSTFRIVGENLGPGIYQARLYFDGVFTATTKIMSVR